MIVLKDEILVQAKTFNTICHGDNCRTIKAIDLWGSLCREIINEFECKQDRVCTEDELIYILSEHARENVRIYFDIRGE